MSFNSLNAKPRSSRATRSGRSSKSTRPEVLRNREQYLQVAAEAARKIRCWKSGSCRYAAEEITKALVHQGLLGFQVVEGYVRQPSGFYGPKNQHTWILLRDGTRIDPTFIQFEEGTAYAGIKKKHRPVEYLIPNPKDAAFERQYPEHRQEFYQTQSRGSQDRKSATPKLKKSA